MAAEEPTAAAQLLGPAPSPVTASYDLLAVQPLADRVFQQARCLICGCCIHPLLVQLQISHRCMRLHKKKLLTSHA